MELVEKEVFPNLGNNDINAFNEEGDTPLIQAIRQGNVNMVKHVLNEGANVDKRNKEHLSPVGLAASEGDIELIKILIDHNANLDLGEPRPLTAAVKKGNKEVISLLIASGAKIDNKDRHNLTPVFHAVVSSDVEVLEMLLKAGGSPDARDRYEGCALLRAACDGKDDMVQMLLKYGADVKKTTKYGDMALIMASLACSAETIQMMIDLGAPVGEANSRGDTALHVAAMHKRSDIVRVLVKAGADVNQRSHDGNPPLLCAARNGSVIVQELINAGADLDSANLLGNTALIIASMWGCFDTVVCLVEAGANIDMSNFEGETAIMAAARSNRNKVVLYLLSKEANVCNAHRVTQGTVLAYVCSCCLPETALYLINFKTNEELLIDHMNRSGFTALTYACSADRLEVVCALLARGANISPLTLTVAAQKARLETVQYLVEAGADVNARDEFGLTALHYAVRRNKPDIVKYLLWKDAQATSALHSAILLQNNQIVQIMVQNGAVPSVQSIRSLQPLSRDDSFTLYTSFLDFVCDLGTNKRAHQLPEQSPLCVALLNNQADLAKYFISNWFFTNFDVTTMFRIKRRMVKYLLDSLSFECARLVLAVYHQPWRLQTLSFVAASMAAGEGNKRAESIHKLKPPFIFIKRLQFQDSSAFVSEELWNTLDISV